ncbi:MAG: Rossmann-like and DUF2520 domain-containing protein [Ginsengibacter sp.]
MKIVMLGSGNTATILSVLIKSAGHELVQIISRNPDNAKQLASLYGAKTGSLSDTEYEEADMYIVALNDAALDSIHKNSALKDKFVVHTAGAVSMNVLKNCSDKFGVLYPLQSLSKVTTHVPEIPFLVDGNTQENRHKILGFAKSLSGKVIEADDKQRLNYHVAAVFVSNFSNHMYALGELFCQKERLEFEALFPLINEVNERIKNHSPFLTQTGPAIRNDVFTLNRHLQALAPYPELRYTYLKMTESIIKIHGKEKEST